MKRLIFSVACACAVSAFAQDSKTIQPQASTVPFVSDEAHVQALRDYWSLDRMAAAQPMPIPKVDPASVDATAAPAAPGPIHFGGGGTPTVKLNATSEVSSESFPLSQGDEDSNADVTATPDGFSYEMPFNNFRTGINNTYPYSAIGKLFFTIPPGTSVKAGDYVCSAAVSGASQSYIVTTARHCVFDYVSQKWYSNWVFYPGWNNGSNAALGGAWYPDLIATWTGKATLSETTGWDIALMTMHDSTGTGCGGDKGKTIGSITGWLGYSYGGDYSQRQWNIFGYPQASPFEGNYLYQDNGATGAVNPLGSTNVVEVGNPQTGGTSGGPWIIGFNPKDAKDPSPNNNTNPGDNNLENGVNSFQWTKPSEPLAINGTVFTEANYWNLYQFLLKQTCK
jgi:hypothetical protein